MDFLNKAWTQLTDLFRSMTPGARITAGLLLAVVVISLGYLLRYQGSGPNAYLLSGQHFSPAEIDAMEAAFAKANLNGYQIEGTRIKVPRSQQHLYVAALADGNALPRQFLAAFDEAVKAASPFESREQREQREKAAKQRELSLVVSKLPGMENAVVLYDTDVKPGLSKETVTRASVSVKPRGSEHLKEQQAESIRQTVAAAIKNLDPQRVTVLDLNSGKTFYGSPDGLGSSMDDPYVSRKRTYEQDWNGKILNALSYIPGVTVSANVELDKSKELYEEEVKHETKAVPYQVNEKTTTRTVEGSAPAGRPGPVSQTANAPTSLANAQAKGTREEEEHSENQTVNAIPGKRVEKKTAGLTPQRVTVTVGIPASYFKKVWLERNPPEPGAPPKTPEQKDLDPIRTQVLASIVKQVATLLPKPDGAGDASDLVTATEFQDITPPTLPEPSLKENVLGWFAESWSTLGLIALAFFSLWMLRSMIRAVPAVEPAPALAAASAPAAEKREEEPKPAPVNRLKRLRKPGMSLREELSELVADDPDAAANILRTWIGNAS